MTRTGCPAPCAACGLSRAAPTGVTPEPTPGRPTSSWKGTCLPRTTKSSSARSGRTIQMADRATRAAAAPGADHERVAAGPVRERRPALDQLQPATARWLIHRGQPRPAAARYLEVDALPHLPRRGRGRAGDLHRVHVSPPGDGRRAGGRGATGLRGKALRSQLGRGEGPARIRGLQLLDTHALRSGEGNPCRGAT